MAVDKLVDSTQLDADLTSVANAIRTKGGTSSQLAFPAGFVSAVQAIPTGGVTPTGTKSISITANGVTTEDVTNYASAQITANVPNTYSAGDEGKAVSNGALVAQGSDTVTENDTYDTTLISSLTVNVSGGGTPSGYGNPYTKVMHGAGGFTISGVSSIAWDTYGSGTANTRRSIWAVSGDHQVKRRTGSSSYADDSNLYPIEIPANKTKISYSQDKSGQAIMMFVHYDSGAWKSVSDTGWVNLPVEEYTIPSGATHVCITLRSNSSNTAFSATTDPYYGTIEFS